LKDKSKDNTDISLKVGDNIVQDQHEVANVFANYFATIADNIGNIPVNTGSNASTNHANVKKIKDKWSDNIFSFRKITHDEVLKALNQVNPHKAMGYDLVPPGALKIAADEIAASLTLIYNQAIEQGVWPEDWKRGEWTPVHKKDDPLNKINYRPVTILTSVDKIFEQLLCKQLKNLSEKIFDTFMSAYRTTYSCETTLVRLIEDWKLALDKNKAVAVLSTDMSKAFDSMYPPLLLAKLQAYGLSCHSTTLLKSYFEDRKNRVRLGNVTSGWKTINRGCPQGSALGPVLWNIYQNDLFYEDIESQLSMYTDDHQLYSSNEDVEKVTKVLERDGRTTAEWYRGNHLEGNLSKYEVMVLARSKQDVRDVVIDDFTISQTEQFKLLGVILDRGLNFTDHISLYALQQP